MYAIRSYYVGIGLLERFPNGGELVCAVRGRHVQVIEYFDGDFLARGRLLVFAARYEYETGSHDRDQRDDISFLREFHGHGNGNLVQRDFVKEDPHIHDRIDCHTGLADVAHDAIMRNNFV